MWRIPRLKITIAVLAHLFCLHSPSAKAQVAGDSFPAGKVHGEVNLTSDAIEYGVSQSDKSFALQTLLGYKWTQFRVGLWGSNVKFPGSDDNLNLRFFGAYQFIFTTNSSMTVRYDMNRYYKSGDRNGSLIGVDINLFDYHVMYYKNDKFHGTDAEHTRFGFAKSFEIPWSLMLELDAGYNMFSDIYSNYFDLKSQINYKWSSVYNYLGLSYSTGASQFDNSSFAFYFGIKTSF